MTEATPGLKAFDSPRRHGLAGAGHVEDQGGVRGVDVASDRVSDIGAEFVGRPLYRHLRGVAGGRLSHGTGSPSETQNESAGNRQEC